MPPPCAVAVLPEIVELSKAIVPVLSSERYLCCVGRSVSDPMLMPPPELAVLPVTVESTTLALPAMYLSNRIPPPNELSAPLLPETVLRAIVTALPPLTPVT